MDLHIALLAFVVGYFIGAISFARVLTRIFAPGTDLMKTQIASSKADGKMTMEAVNATAVSMKLGPRLGFATVVLDMLKITIPTLAVKVLFPETSYLLLTATGGMIGHIWPVYYKFRGGRGLSAVYGGMFAIDWIGVFATAFGGVILGMFILRNVLVAYMGGLWLLIPWLWFRTHDWAYVAYGIAVNIIFLLAMIPELRQIIRLRRQGVQADFSKDMQLTAMGRGLYRMARRFGVLKEESAGNGRSNRQG
jgi:glycerol-3-phosphate acyltransferase PlsY